MMSLETRATHIFFAACGNEEKNNFHAIRNVYILSCFIMLSTGTIERSTRGFSLLLLVVLIMRRG